MTTAATPHHHHARRPRFGTWVKRLMTRSGTSKYTNNSNNNNNKSHDKSLGHGSYNRSSGDSKENGYMSHDEPEQLVEDRPQRLAGSHSRVQIVESRPSSMEHSGSGSGRRVDVRNSSGATASSVVTDDSESISSRANATNESKRRSNSNFTIPSVSRSSITTVSPSVLSQQDDAVSITNTIPQAGSITSNLLQSYPVDTASVITIASSSKHLNRRSFDTNASTMAIAPESIMSRRGSAESLLVKSITSSSRHRITASPSIHRQFGDDDDNDGGEIEGEMRNSVDMYQDD